MEEPGDALTFTEKKLAVRERPEDTEREPTKDIPFEVLQDRVLEVEDTEKFLPRPSALGEIFTSVSDTLSLPTREGLEAEEEI